jgi:hypothetical protein
MRKNTAKASSPIERSFLNLISNDSTQKQQK